MRSTIQIVTTKYVSAPAQCHARHPQHHQTPPRAAGLTRARTGMHPLQQGPSRQVGVTRARRPKLRPAQAGRTRAAAETRPLTAPCGNRGAQNCR